MSDDAADLKTRFATHRDSTNNPHSVTATQVGLGNVTNESKATMFTDPTFTGTVSGVTASMVGLGNVTNESKATMFTDAALTGVPTAPTAAATTNTTQIATTAFVQGEINTAALALGTNYSVADIEERDQLQDLVVGDIIFVADNGDTKWAQYKVTVASPNEEFLKIMDQDILINALDAPGIKTAYESNADTNAFTDAEQTRLAGLELGVTVQPFDANTVVDANYETFDSSATYPDLRAQATTAGDVGLDNVTNESKATMFTDPTFTGTVTGVTKNHVGLGNVENYKIATKEEAENGTVSDKYMTPETTADAIAFQTDSILIDGEYVNQTSVENQIASIGGDGLVFDSGEDVYNLDYATQEEIESGESTVKVLTPASIQFMVIDGGEFN